MKNELLIPVNIPIIVCEEKNCLYFKPPKTGGTSIYHHFLKINFKTLSEKYNEEEFNNWLENLTQEKVDKYFKFSIVRNPWDRLVSIYAYFKHDKRKQFFPDGIVPSFSNFIKEFESYKTRAPLVFNHGIDLHKFTHFNENQFVDFIGRFENLNDDFKKICEIISAPIIELPITNTSEREHYSVYYDNELKILFINYIEKILIYSIMNINNYS